MWNSGDATLVHIDVLPAYEERKYVPDLELVGDIAATLNLLASRIEHKLELSQRASEILVDRQHQRDLLDRRGASLNQFALHPLRIVRAMQDIVNNDVTLTVDMGSFHIWIARYLYSFRARQVMISNGQQTMGVALPWAIGAWLVNPGRKVVSVSGDGGFLQSSMELETAVRLNANILHIIWVDNAYNMVAIRGGEKISASLRRGVRPGRFQSLCRRVRCERLCRRERRRARTDAACGNGCRWPGRGGHSRRLQR